MSEWVSVKERLPEKPGLYLIYVSSYGYMETCFYSSHAGWQYGRGDEAKLITHWMSLPEPPEGVPGVKIDSRLRYDLARVLEKECEIEVTGWGERR